MYVVISVFFSVENIMLDKYVQEISYWMITFGKYWFRSIAYIEEFTPTQLVFNN